MTKSRHMADKLIQRAVKNREALVALPGVVVRIAEGEKGIEGFTGNAEELVAACNGKRNTRYPLVQFSKSLTVDSLQEKLDSMNTQASIFCTSVKSAGAFAKRLGVVTGKGSNENQNTVPR